MKIIGISIFDRVKEAGLTQKVLSRYGDVIQLRLGLHEVSMDVCSRHGIILLKIRDDDKIILDNIMSELSLIGGIEIKYMEFSL